MSVSFVLYWDFLRTSNTKKKKKEFNTLKVYLKCIKGL